MNKREEQKSSCNCLLPNGCSEIRYEVAIPPPQIMPSPKTVPWVAHPSSPLGMLPPYAHPTTAIENCLYNNDYEITVLCEIQS